MLTRPVWTQAVPLVKLRAAAVSSIDIPVTEHNECKFLLHCCLCLVAHLLQGWQQALWTSSTIKRDVNNLQ